MKNMSISKVGDRSRGRPEGSLFNSYYTEMLERALLLSQDCSYLPWIYTLYCWVLSKEVSSTVLKVFGMTRPGIEARSHGPLANTQPTRPMSWLSYIYIYEMSMWTKRRSIYIYIYIYIYSTLIFMYTQRHMLAYIYIYIYIYICIYIYIHTYMCASICVWLYMRISVA